jgi:hypothetical protein
LRSAIAARTRAAVASATGPVWLITRLTVATDTFARRAMSRIVVAVALGLVIQVQCLAVTGFCNRLQYNIEGDVVKEE